MSLFSDHDMGYIRSRQERPVTGMLGMRNFENSIDPVFYAINLLVSSFHFGLDGLGHGDRPAG